MEKIQLFYAKTTAFWRLRGVLSYCVFLSNFARNRKTGDHIELPVHHHH
jgi:hypothetical protein